MDTKLLNEVYEKLKPRIINCGGGDRAYVVDWFNNLTESYIVGEAWLDENDRIIRAEVRDDNGDGENLLFPWEAYQDGSNSFYEKLAFLAAFTKICAAELQKYQRGLEAQRG